MPREEAESRQRHIHDPRTTHRTAPKVCSRSGGATCSVQSDRGQMVQVDPHCDGLSEDQPGVLAEDYVNLLRAVRKESMLQQQFWQKAAEAKMRRILVEQFRQQQRRRMEDKRKWHRTGNENMPVHEQAQ
mmetsp:Transcript_25454/g.49746  ORF Transcript_25454/g.49746 Transcript_25454/m.49746 type:complete len:130 (-) Transcript_25454:166-555(-)